MPGRQVSNDPFSGRIHAIKIWNTALTEAEIAQEVYTVAPRKLDSLWGWNPTRPGSGERAKDYSGNGRNWTEGGTLTDDDPPPISWAGASGGAFALAQRPTTRPSPAHSPARARSLAETGKTLAGTLTSAGALVRRTTGALADPNPPAPRSYQTSAQSVRRHTHGSCA